MRQRSYESRAQLIAEDDPQWVRFWDAFPRRQGKLDARKAWTQLQPDTEMVNAILDTLAWQVPVWGVEHFKFAPLPASWIRGRRWEDEVLLRLPLVADEHGHIPSCRTLTECIAKALAEGRAKVAAS